MYRPWPDYTSALVWTQRASWICFYAFCEDDQNFHLITSGYSPEREIKVREEESREEELETLQDEFERREEGSERSSDGSKRSEQKDFFKRWMGKLILVKFLFHYSLGLP
jgi:hypothetical protein